VVLSFQQVWNLQYGDENLDTDQVSLSVNTLPKVYVEAISYFRTHNFRYKFLGYGVSNWVADTNGYYE